jgi:hypothetical protein
MASWNCAELKASRSNSWSWEVWKKGLEKRAEKGIA